MRKQISKFSMKGNWIVYINEVAMVLEYEPGFVKIVAKYWQLKKHGLEKHKSKRLFF